MVLGHMVLCTHGLQPMVLHEMEPIKRLRRLHCNVGLEVSSEGSLGQIGQGFGQCIMKFHWLGFSLDLGVFLDKLCL